MKKIKQLQAEQAFILSASPAKLTEYVNQYPFRPKSEKVFVETAPNKTIALYIELYGLKPAAAIVIFRQGNPDLVHKLIAWCNEDVELIRAFLDHGQWQQVHNYVNDFDVPLLPEQEALKRFDQDELLELITTTKLSAFAAYDILVRGNEELKLALINKNKGLNKREIDYILNFGSRPQLEALIAIATQPATIEYRKQIMLIRFGKKKHLLAFIAKGRFLRRAEEFFLKTAPFEVLLIYVKHYRPEGGDVALLNHPDRNGILNYLSKHWICEEGENLLLKRGEHEEIKAYIKRHTLSPDNEIRLIKRCKHREIMLYLTNHTLSAEAQIELIYRRNTTELCYLVSTYPLTLTDEALETLDKCGMREVKDVYEDVMESLF